MLDTDAGNFERALKRLCAAFNVPLTEHRLEAFWRSFRKLELLEFTGLADLALVESTYTSLPTVGQLWELHRKHAAPKVPSQEGPNLIEQLNNFAMRQVGKGLTATELSRPWTYVHRHGELVGVIIERDNGTRLQLSVASMQGEALA